VEKIKLLLTNTSSYGSLYIDYLYVHHGSTGLLEMHWIVSAVDILTASMSVTILYG